MKRFYCPKCKRIVRARTLPPVVDLHVLSMDSVTMSGLCFQHRTPPRRVSPSYRRGGIVERVP